MKENNNFWYGLAGGMIALALFGWYLFSNALDTQQDISNEEGNIENTTATSSEEQNGGDTTTATSSSSDGIETGITLTPPQKKYINVALGFQFEYPDDWNYREEERNTNQFALCLAPNDWDIHTTCPVSVVATEGVALNDVYTISKRIFTSLKVVESKGAVTGELALFLSVSGYKQEEVGYTRLAFFEYKGRIYDIRTINGGENVFAHILASFK
jgi:hypothetical protein